MPVFQGRPRPSYGLSLAPVLLFSVFLTACPLDTGFDEDLYGECLQIMHFDDGTSIVSGRDESGIGQITQPLNVASATVWEDRSVPVCWEGAAEDDEARLLRESVREAVEATWVRALDDPRVENVRRLRFTGWERCEENSDGIRIAVSDERPHVRFLGSRLNGVRGGMVLNFSFKNWSEECGTTRIQRQWCTILSAVHEFGHALGLSHEQNRQDTPDSCEDEPQGANGDIYYGEWDENSVMNYCNPYWNNWGRMSRGDATWIKVVYYPELFAERWCEDIASMPPGEDGRVEALTDPVWLRNQLIRREQEESGLPENNPQ